MLTANDIPSMGWINRLMSLDTTSRNSNLDLVDLVEQEAHRLGLSPLRVPNEDGTKANLWVTVPAADGGTDGGVVLSAHTDVVPVDGQDWEHDPFTPQVRDGRLSGRGACDMKGFLGVVMHRLADFATTPLRRPVHFALSYDEEVGCHGAARMLDRLSELGVTPTTCIVGEPTGMRVVTGHKSINLFRLTVRGVAAHSSLTPSGVNAVEYAAALITFIRRIADDFRTDGPFDDAYDVPYTTASVNQVAGGIAGNTVADRCDVVFEFRSIGAVDPQAVLDRIRARCDEVEHAMRAENPLARVELETIAMVPGLETAPVSPAVHLATGLGGTGSSAKVTFGTEAGLFHAAGMQTVVCGPGHIAQAHAANEYVELEQIRACEGFVSHLLDHLRRSP